MVFPLKNGNSPGDEVAERTLVQLGPHYTGVCTPPPPPHRVLDSPLLEASVLLSPISCFQPEWIIKQNGEDNYGVK